MSPQWTTTRCQMKIINIPETRKITYGKELSTLIKKVMGRDKIKALRFSMFDTDEESGGYGSGDSPWHILIPELESAEPVFGPSPVVLTTNYWRVVGDDGPVYSPVLESPTWGPILAAVDDILAEGDGCGVFLEGFDDTGKTTYTGARIIDISIGS